MKKIAILIVTSILIILSCTENQEIDNSLILAKTRSGTEETKINRLLVNSAHSVIVTHNYNYSQLISIDFEMAESLPEDKFGILRFLDASQNNQDVKLVSFDSFDITQMTSHTDINPSGVEYGCDCKSVENSGDTNDCTVKTYLNEVYCDGNLCSGCSLQVKFLTSNNAQITLNTSVILLPNNFEI